MSTKRKNDETAVIAYEQSWIANLQRRLGWIKTQEIEVNASPAECLEWIERLADHPPASIKAWVDTQSTKRPYQFKARLRVGGYRSPTLGPVVGDVIQSPESNHKSLVSLRLYQFGSYSSFITGVVLVVALFSWGIYLITAGGKQYSLASYLFLACFGSMIIGAMMMATMIPFRQRNQVLDIAVEYLLRLNSPSEEPLPPEAGETSQAAGQNLKNPLIP